MPETKIGNVNGLNKRLGWKIGVKKDNENQKLIKEQWICSLAEVVIEGPEVDIIAKIKIARRKDKEVVKVVEKRWWIASGRRFSVKRGKGIYAKG